jgi:hypothetical protein
MGRAFTAIGIVALIGAVAWWQTFYGEAQRFLGPPGPLPLECLYSLSSACRIVADTAEVFGANSYHPLIFWTACACLLVGLVMGSRVGGPKRATELGPGPDHDRKVVGPSIGPSRWVYRRIRRQPSNAARLLLQRGSA